MTINANQDYRETLREAYEARLARNPKYSLRAFARDLGLAPSRIVEVLQYKRGLSRAGGARIARGLGLQAKETETFLNLIDSVHGRSELVRSRASKALREARAKDDSALRLDLFKLIADWYHYAILELTAVDGFESNEDWIAARLGVSKTVIAGAIERLKRLGLLVEEDGVWKARDEMTYSTTDIPSEGLRRHHEQILAKAKDAIYTQPVESRDFSALTMAIRREDVPLAKAMIKKFRRELSMQLEAGSAKNAVYNLAIQFFQLDDFQLPAEPRVTGKKMKEREQ
jgi:uncharacterized protein (TIGR02147 family)